MKKLGHGRHYICTYRPDKIVNVGVKITIRNTNAKAEVGYAERCCDLSDDRHGVGQRIFLQTFVTGTVTNLKQKISFQVYYALSQGWTSVSHVGPH